MADELLVTSADGVELRVRRAGRGEPIVFVHGTMGTVVDWAPVASRLSDRFETNVLERRGRGRSSDAAEYSLDREVDDVRAVIDRCAGPVHLVGHSFGAVVALLAAARSGADVASLVVFEPPIGGDGDPSVLADDLDRLVAEDRPDAAIARFVGAANGSTDHLDRLTEPVRAGLRDAVRSAAREIRAASAVLPFEPDMIAAVGVPTCVVLGDEQQLPTYGGVTELADRLPDGRRASVPGHHLALLFEPDALAAVIADHLVSTTGSGASR